MKGRKMDMSSFESQLNQLANEINSVPGDSKSKTDLVALSRRAKIYNKKLRKSAEALEESLEHLRLTVKYLLFDLEATRRENNYLRKLLEDRDDR